MEAQQAVHCHQGDRCYYQCSEGPPPAEDGELGVLRVSDKDPGRLPDDGQAVSGHGEEHPEEGLVVLAPNAVVEVLAVVVEVLGAAVALPAVVTLGVHLGVAVPAEEEVALLVLPLYFEDEVVDGVRAGEEAVVVADQQQQGVGEPDQDPQDFGPDRHRSRCDKCGEQGSYDHKEDDREHLLEGRPLRVCICFAVLPLPFLSLLEPPPLNRSRRVVIIHLYIKRLKAVLIPSTILSQSLLLHLQRLVKERKKGG